MFRFHNACLANDETAIKHLLSTATQFQLRQGLSAACESGNRTLFQVLVNHGARDFDYALYGACRGGHLSMVNLCEKHGAKNWTEGLRGACSGGQLKFVIYALHRGATLHDLSFLPACVHGHCEIMEFLINTGLLNKTALNTALHCASTNNQVRLAEFLIQKGADELNHALFCACNRNHIEVAKLLIMCGANDWSFIGFLSNQCLKELCAFIWEQFDHASFPLPGFSRRILKCFIAIIPFHLTEKQKTIVEQLYSLYPRFGRHFRSRNVRQVQAEKSITELPPSIKTCILLNYVS